MPLSLHTNICGVKDEAFFVTCNIENYFTKFNLLSYKIDCLNQFYFYLFLF